jgi:hypothetical protein
VKKYLLISWIILIWAPAFLSQIYTDTLRNINQGIPGNLLFSNFNKILNTFHLNTGFNLYGEFSNVSIEVNENFRSTYFESITKSIRDEQYFTLNSKYRLSNISNVGIAANSTILSDDRNILLNQSNINYLTLFTELNFSSNFLFSPYGGYTSNKQLCETDTGPVYGFEGSTDNLSYPGFSISSVFRFRNEDILPRKNLLRYFNLTLTNPFNPSVSNTLAGRYSSTRKDFYFPTDSITSAEFDITNNIESRTETIFLAEDRLRYNDFFSNVDFEIRGGANWRTINRDKRYQSAEIQAPTLFNTKIEELILSLESALFYHSAFFDLTLNFNLAERDEKHLTIPFSGGDRIFFIQRSELEARKNNNSVRATLALTGNFKFSRTDKVILSLYHNKLRYDTPSPDNDDDRDEILTILRMRYSKDLSPFFQAFVNAEATINPVVYLFASRSSNNNVNRVLRLAAGGYYRGANVSSLNTFEISANYTVYDFEDISTSLRSFSFRQFTATDSSRVKIGKRFAFVITGYIKISENADLNWGEFTVRPTRFINEIYADPKFLLVFNRSEFGLGVRYFSLRTYNYDGLTKIPDSDFLSVGPLIDLIFNVYSSLYLKVDGWYEFITINNLAEQERANFLMTLNWNF